MLWRCMKPAVECSGWKERKNNFKGLDPAIEIFIVDCILIVPHSCVRSRHLVCHEENTVVAGIRLDRIANHSACPCFNGRLLPGGRAKRAKIEIRRTTTHALLLVGNVVKHVALAWVSLAPGVFVRDHVLCFGKVGSARILRWDQVARFHQNSVRGDIMNVAAVIVRCVT